MQTWSLLLELQYEAIVCHLLHCQSNLHVACCTLHLHYLLLNYNKTIIKVHTQWHTLKTHCYFHMHRRMCVSIYTADNSVFEPDINPMIIFNIEHPINHHFLIHYTLFFLDPSMKENFHHFLLLCNLNLLRANIFLCRCWCMCDPYNWKFAN